MARVKSLALQGSDTTTLFSSQVITSAACPALGVGISGWGWLRFGLWFDVRLGLGLPFRPLRVG